MDTLYSPCSSKPSCLKFNIVTTYIAEVLVQLSWCIFIYLHPQLLMQFLAYIKKTATINIYCTAVASVSFRLVGNGLCKQELKTETLNKQCFFKTTITHVHKYMNRTAGQNAQ